MPWKNWWTWRIFSFYFVANCTILVVQVWVILTKIGAVGHIILDFFVNNIIVFVLTRPKMCLIFQNFHAFLSFQKILFTYDWFSTDRVTPSSNELQYWVLIGCIVCDVTVLSMCEMQISYRSLVVSCDVRVSNLLLTIFYCHMVNWQLLKLFQHLCS